MFVPMTDAAVTTNIGMVQFKFILVLHFDERPQGEQRFYVCYTHAWITPTAEKLLWIKSTEVRNRNSWSCNHVPVVLRANPSVYCSS